MVNIPVKIMQTHKIMYGNSIITVAEDLFQELIRKKQRPELHDVVEMQVSTGEWVKMRLKDVLLEN